MTNKNHKDIPEEEIALRINESYGKIDSVAQVIQLKQRFKNRHIWLIELIATVPVAPILMHFTQKTDLFYATDNCISCGLCEKLCPDTVIQMKEGKPTWNRGHCTHCMSCIQNCPKKAIEFGMLTKERRRYTFSKYRGMLK